MSSLCTVPSLIQASGEVMIRIGKAVRRFVRPLEADREAALEDRWTSLDPQWRTPYQAFGTKMTGCAAVTGMHPRCDFSCTGCYLGDDANTTPPFPLEDVLRQLDRIRAWTGPKGNLQVTDGEVTLRPVNEMLAILRYAREIDLIPMVMTHGDTFRQTPGLLRRLVVDGGLTEISIHIDVTMRGRQGYRNATTEEELRPLREEFARMIRSIPRETGCDLRAATTMTVTRDNLAGVAHVARWCAKNRDAFRMLSLQPLADVGRTREDLQGVGVDELWAEVAKGLETFGAEVGDGGPIHVGHPACNRIASFLCFALPGEKGASDVSPGEGQESEASRTSEESIGSEMRRESFVRFVKTIRAGQDEDREFLEALRATGLMGVGYRDDPPIVGLARKAGAIVRGLPFVAGRGRRFASRRLRELGLSLPGTVLRVLAGRLRIDGFSVVSHHFMNRSEVTAPLGQERLAACVFRLPVGDRMVSMCEVNLLGLREAAYSRGSAFETPSSLTVLDSSLNRSSA